jgi:hypothetical protein
MYEYHDLKFFKPYNPLWHFSTDGRFCRIVAQTCEGKSRWVRSHPPESEGHVEKRWRPRLRARKPGSLRNLNIIGPWAN